MTKAALRTTVPTFAGLLALLALLLNLTRVQKATVFAGLVGVAGLWLGMAQFIEFCRTNGLNAATPAATAQCLRNAANYELPDYSNDSLKPGAVWAKYLASAPQSTQFSVIELQRVIARERTAAIKDLIAHLRTTTGRDLGDDPQPWIKEFANQKYPRPQQPAKPAEG